MIVNGLIWSSFLVHIRLTENGLGQLAQLKKEHRSFMRGKQNIYGFYEDKQVLADVEIISFITY